MGRKSNRERWIEAMNRITCSLIGESKLQQEEVIFVCRCFRKDAPQKTDSRRLEMLEREAAMVPPIPDYIRSALEGDRQVSSSPEQSQCTHYWMLDSSNLGVCKYCGVKEQF